MTNTLLNSSPCLPDEPMFEVDGTITEVLPGCGLAAVEANNRDFTLNRNTEGVHFEDLHVGQKIHCQIARQNQRVLYGHLQTQPLRIG